MNFYFKNLDKPQIKFNFILTIILFGLFSNVFFHLLNNYFNFFPLTNNTSSTFLHQKINYFSDFFSIFDNFVFYKFSIYSIYFPFSNIFLYIFSFFENLTSTNSLLIFLFASVFGLLIMIRFFNRNIFHFDSLLFPCLLIFFSYPFIFSLTSANFELIVFIFIFGFCGFHYLKCYRLASFFLAIAASIKLYPLIFCMIFLFDKKFKEIILVFIWLIALTIIPFIIWPVSFDLYVDGLLRGVEKYNNLMAINQSNFCHSIMCFFKISNVISRKFHMEYSFIYIFILFVFLLISLIAVSKSSFFWKKLTIISCFLCLVPVVSTDYKLLLLLIPCLFFIKDGKLKGSFQFSFLFALLLIPKGYFLFFNIQGGYYDLYSSSHELSNSFLLFILFFFTTYDIFKEYKDIEVIKSRKILYV